MPVCCPHCRTPIDDAEAPWPPQPTRCEACRLVIGAQRAPEISGTDARARSHSSAAGTLAARMRRVASAEDVEPASPESIAESLGTVARQLDTPVARLRMLDYESAAGEAGLVPLAAIIARHGSWKTARAEVAAAARGDGGA